MNGDITSVRCPIQISNTTSPKVFLSNILGDTKSDSYVILAAKVSTKLNICGPHEFIV